MTNKNSGLNKKQENLIRMMYNEDLNAEKVMNALSIDQKELETLVEDLVNKGFLRLTGADELELTEQGKLFCKAGIINSGNSHFKEQNINQSDKNKFDNLISKEKTKTVEQDADKKNIDEKVTKICICGIVVVVILVAVGYFAGWGNTDEGPSATAAEEVAWDYVRDELKCPSTAKFDLGADVYEYGNDTWRVTGHGDAENSFGAMVRFHYDIKLRYTGGDEFSKSNWDVIYCNVI